MKLLNYENILESIRKKNRIMRMIVLCIGTFIVALIYNAYIVPNNIVYGGVGGLAILASELFGIGTTLFINVVTFSLIGVSLLLLGLKKTSYTIIGFLIYDIMINITAPLAPFVHLEFDSFLFSILVYGTISGFGFGLIYKTGFNTGGSDTIIAIVQHYFKLPTAKVSGLINGAIIISGMLTFGVVKSIYAIVFLKTINFISDCVILGISTHKICFIKTNHRKEVEEFLKDELEVGYTLIDSRNGVGILKKILIFCVIPSDRFYDLKQELNFIDKKAELISKDCYTVEGGVTNRIISV